MVAVLLVATGVGIYFRTSRFGLALRAMTQDAVSASMAGLDVVRARAIVWLISALVAGLAGGAYAWNLSVFYPDALFTLQISVFAIVFALFGGVGTVVGPLLGAAILYSFYAVIGISTPQYFELIYGLLIVLLVLFLPNGVMSFKCGLATTKYKICDAAKFAIEKYAPESRSNGVNKIAIATAAAPPPSTQTNTGKSVCNTSSAVA